MKITIIKKNKLIEDIPQNKIKEYLKQKDTLVWIDLFRPVQKEYDFIQKTFDLHPLSIEDCSKPINLPKYDLFDKYLFVVFHGPALEHKKVDFKKKEIDFFLGKQFLITVHSYKIDVVSDVFDSLKIAKTNSVNSGFLLYQIIDYIVDQYFPMLDDWQDYIEDLETNIINNNHNKHPLEKIMIIKREILHVRKSITPEIELINSFTKKNYSFFDSKTILYFKDVHDHLMRIYSELETQRDLLKNVFDIHNSMISKQMTETSNKMNQVMQKMTIIATIFMPLTFITGIYGMNFHNMPELYWKYGYFIILGVMLMIGFLMYATFKKKEWV